MKLGLVDQIVKILPGMQEVKVQSMTQEDPLEKETATTRVFLLGEFHGQRTLVDYQAPLSMGILQARILE